MVDSKYIGLILALCSSLLIGTSFVITKKGLQKSKTANGQCFHFLSYFLTLHPASYHVAMSSFKSPTIYNQCSYLGSTIASQQPDKRVLYNRPADPILGRTNLYRQFDPPPSIQL